jgi:branched-chain amino acid transport system permease protein
MARATADVRGYLDRNYPRLSKKVPDGVIVPANVWWTGWKRIGYLRYVLIGLLMAVIPYLMNHNIIPLLNGDYGKGVLVVTGYWILLALGLNVVVGFAGLLDLGYIAFFMLGAYTTALMTNSGDPNQFHIVQWPVWAALPFALLVAMAAGVAIGLPTLRLRGDYLAIVTLGFHAAVIVAITNMQSITNGPRGIFGIPNPSFPGALARLLRIESGGSFGLTSEYYWWYLLIPAILLAVIMVRHLDNSRVGRYWTAIREDEVAAAAMGVPVTRMKVLAFMIGASTSGIAGWIYATYLSFIAPGSFSILYSILALCAVTVGGLGSVAGAVFGAILVIALPEAIRQAAGGHTIFGFDPLTGRVAIFGLLLILVMIFRPGGIFAARRRRTELTTPGEDKAVVYDEAMLKQTAAQEDLFDAGKEGSS